MKFKLKSKNVLLAFVLICIAITFFVSYISAPKPFEAEPEHNLPFNSGWFVVNQDGSHQSLDDLPTDVDVPINTVLTLTNTIPANDDITTICFRSKHQKVRVFVDDTEIYFHGYYNNEKDKTATSQGCTWNMIRLPDNSAGKAIFVELESSYPIYSGYVPSFMVGTKASIMSDIIQDHLFNLIIGIVLLVIGLFLITLYLLLKKIENLVEFKFLGEFFSLIGIWIISESKLFHFSYDNGEFVLILACLAFLGIWIPLFKFLASYKEFYYKKTINCIVIYLYAQLVVMCLLQTFGIADFIEMMVYANITTCICGVISIYLLVLCTVKLKRSSLISLLVSFLLFFVAGIFELIIFLTNHTIKMGSLLLGTIIVFVIYESIILLRKSLKIIGLSRIAGIDSLTDTKNRNLYMLAMKKLYNKPFCTVVADLDNLKTINDTFGHAVGDKAIIKCSKCLKKVFGQYGEIYRIGGDEFVFLGSEIQEKELIKLVNQFYNECARAKLNFNFNFSVSAGFSIFDSQIDAKPNDTIKRADKYMYKTKVSKKEALNHN